MEKRGRKKTVVTLRFSDGKTVEFKLPDDTLHR